MRMDGNSSRTDQTFSYSGLRQCDKRCTEYCLISSDLGTTPVHTEGMEKDYITTLFRLGISEKEIDLVARRNPARLLGVSKVAADVQAITRRDVLAAFWASAGSWHVAGPTVPPAAGEDSRRRFRYYNTGCGS